MVLHIFRSSAPYPIILGYKGPLSRAARNDEARRVRVIEKEYDFHMLVPEVPVLEGGLDAEYIDRMISGEFHSMYGSGYVHHRVLGIGPGSTANGGSVVFLNVLVTLRGEDRLEFYAAKAFRYLKSIWSNNSH